MAYGYSILGVQITNDMKEFEKDYAKWQEKKARYDAKRSSKTRKTAMEKAWTKAAETARRLNARGKLSQSAARRMGIAWTPDGGNAPSVVAPVNTIDPVTGLSTADGTVAPMTVAPTSSPVLPLAIGGVVFATIVGVILLRRR